MGVFSFNGTDHHDERRRHACLERRDWPNASAFRHRPDPVPHYNTRRSAKLSPSNLLAAVDAASFACSTIASQRGAQPAFYREALGGLPDPFMPVAAHGRWNAWPRILCPAAFSDTRGRLRSRPPTSKRDPCGSRCIFSRCSGCRCAGTRRGGSSRGFCSERFELSRDDLGRVVEIVRSFG